MKFASPDANPSCEEVENVYESLLERDEGGVTFIYYHNSYL